MGAVVSSSVKWNHLAHFRIQSVKHNFLNQNPMGSSSTHLNQILIKTVTNAFKNKFFITLTFKAPTTMKNKTWFKSVLDDPIGFFWLRKLCLTGWIRKFAR